jgi:hypothetical protein
MTTTPASQKQRSQGQGESKTDAPFTTKVVQQTTASSGAADLRAQIVAFARTLVGIQEMPPGSHSNDGPQVHEIQSATGAYKAPWCVSTVQYILLHVIGETVANKTANAYYLAQYAHDNGWTIPHPQAGCAVVYHIGAGHAGTVATVHPDGSFDAVEGNEGDAVRLVPRNPKQIACTFILVPQLRG